MSAQVAGAAGRVVWGVVSDRLFHGSRKRVLVLVSALSALMALALGSLPRSVPAASKG